MTPLERNRLVVALTSNGYHAGAGTIGDWLTADATFAPGRCFTIIAAAPDTFTAATSLTNVAIALTGEGFEPVSANDLPTGAVAGFRATSDAGLHALIRRIYQLSRALPTAPLDAFRARTRGLPSATEAERFVIQRIGQDVFRAGLMEYWSGCCAVTGIDQPELLRASHCKPWSKSSDAERLDIHNGLLLVADVDGAFDAGLITFDDKGAVVLSQTLSATARARFEGFRIGHLHLVTDTHREYLAWHRTNEFRGMR